MRILTTAVLALGLAPLSPAATSSSRDKAPAAHAERSALPASVLGAVDKGDYQEAYDALKAFLKSKGSISPSDGATMQAAMLLELIRVTSPEVLTKVAGENKGYRKFLSQFARDAEWQELYLGQGLVPFKTDVGVKILCRIWAREKGEVKNKALACALASVWGGGETAPNPRIQSRDPSRFNPEFRYAFFQKQKAKGALHPNFPRLRPWELRFVVGIPAQDWDDKSFEWAAKNINLPWDRYHTACWAATYTDPSKFGDSVQSGEYNLPFTQESTAETTQNNGGVCGALSHLGCYAAMAHGIPAYTVGQPGHCAYAVRPKRGKWIGGFGGPDGGMHNHIFGNKAPTSYLLMEAVFADNATIDKAYRESFCARALEATGDAAKAEAMWKTALKTSPLHPFFRTELHRLMKARNASPQEVFEYLHATIPAYKGQGFAAVDMAADLSQSMDAMSDEQKLTLYADMHADIATTPCSWASKCDDVLAKHLKSLGSPAAKEKYLANALTAHMNAGDGTVFGQVLEWGIKEFVSKGGEAQDTFNRAFAQAASAASPVRGGGKEAEARQKAMKSSYGKAIFATEQARSLSAFQAITDAAVKCCGNGSANCALTKAGEIQGKAVPSTSAMLRLSTTSPYDQPIAHREVLSLTGGACHTSNEPQPSYVVEIAQAGELAGCVIRKSNGNEGRMKKAIVYTSSDGATWMKRAETQDMPKEWAVPFPAGTQGKWVKLEFDNSGGKNFSHLSHFVVFTR